MSSTITANATEASAGRNAIASVIAGSTLCRAAAAEPEHAPHRELGERQDRARRPLARAVVAAVAEVEEARVLVRSSRARPQVDVLERPSARPEPPQSDSEVGDGVADGVVDAVRRRRAGARPPSTVTSKPAPRSGSTPARRRARPPRRRGPPGPGAGPSSVPACTTSPPSTITTASQIRSTSSRWWDETTMCIPNSVPMPADQSEHLRSAASGRARRSARRGGRARGRARSPRRA